jgi:hypothetical protein
MSAPDPSRHFATVNCRISKGSFDRLVSDGEHRWRHLDAERSRRLKVGDKLELAALSGYVRAKGRRRW